MNAWDWYFRGWAAFAWIMVAVVIAVAGCAGDETKGEDTNGGAYHTGITKGPAKDEAILALIHRKHPMSDVEYLGGYPDDYAGRKVWRFEFVEPDGDGLCVFVWDIDMEHTYSTVEKCKVRLKKAA